MFVALTNPPSLGAQLHDGYIKTNDLRPAYGVVVSQGADDEERAKSPKKKIFGMSIPTFRTSAASVPTPPMPPKVAKVLGTSPPGRGKRFSPHPGKSTKFGSTPRSDTSKSLPSLLNNHNSHRNRRAYHDHDGSLRYRAASRNSSTKAGRVQVSLDTSMPRLAVPPTPPKKDTPPDENRNLEANQNCGRSQQLQDEGSEEDFIDTGMKLHFPSTPNVDLALAYGRRSPNKFPSHCAEDYVKPIQGPRVLSAYEEIDGTDNKLQRNVVPPLQARNSESFPTPRPKRWSEELASPSRTSLGTRLTGTTHFQLLPSSVYTPAKTVRVTDADGGSSRKVCPPSLRPQAQPSGSPPPSFSH